MADDPVEVAPAGPPPGRSLRRDILIGAAALIAAALIGKALSHGSDAPSSASTPPSSPSVTLAPPNGAVALPPPRANDVAACPEQVTCLTQAAGNGRALLPVRSRLPKAELVRFRTVLLQTRPWAGELWYREFEFRLPDGGPLEIRISVRSQPIEAQHGHIGTQAFAVAPLGRYVVRVTAAETAGLAHGILQYIAADDRLLTT